MLERYAQSDECTAGRGGGDGCFAAKALRALPQTEQTDGTRRAQGTRREPPAIVRDFNLEHSELSTQGDAHFAGLGVAGDVGEGLLDGAYENATVFGIKHDILLRQHCVTTDACAGLKGIGSGANGASETEFHRREWAQVLANSLNRLDGIARDFFDFAKPI
jgi:hypothetical protein